MISRNLTPPATQRTFADCWQELNYLCKKISYWLHVRKHRAGGERYLSRLQRVLRRVPDDDLAIVRQEGLALFHEVKGNFPAAVMHRRLEIVLMERLNHEAIIVNAATRDYMLKDRDEQALQKRRMILDGLAKANATTASKQYASQSGSKAGEIAVT